MTRKWFLNLIGLGAAGQTAIVNKSRLSTEEQNPIMRDNVTVPYNPQLETHHPVYNAPAPMPSVMPKRTKPANGECPVCGTMAPPYILQSGEYMYYDAQLDAWIDLSLAAHYRTRMISCSHCRVMFQQDAERTP